ncbi:MAG: peptidylprolyl isomerase [Bacteroidetes bacterium]|nr:peptidylprolyl isomerase [Bacteroidota bacterium]
MIKKISFSIIAFFIISVFKSQTASTSTYTGKPMFQILTKRNNAVLGTTVVELFPNIAPKHTRNFDSLVSVKFFDTTAFHRVIPGFVIQGGDPNSRHGAQSTWGNGDPTQPTVNAEFSTAKHVRGILSAARDQNINSATSQFFICVATAASLNGQYSVYGRVLSGMNYVDTIVNAPRNSNDCPLQKIEMFITYVGSNDSVPNPPLQTSPANTAIGIDTASQVILKWAKVSDGIIYHIDLTTDSTFNTIWKSVNTGNLLYVTSTVLPASTTYYWRVSTNNGGHFSNFSPVWKFTTAAPFNDVGIKTNAMKSKKPLVYPNPGNGKFTFDELEKESVIEVFDLTGRLISHIFTKENQVHLDLEGKDKGIYIYKVTQNAVSYTGKLIIK